MMGIKNAQAGRRILLVARVYRVLKNLKFNQFGTD